MLDNITYKAPRWLIEAIGFDNSVTVCGEPRPDGTWAYYASTCGLKLVESPDLEKYLDRHYPDEICNDEYDNYILRLRLGLFETEDVCYWTLSDVKYPKDYRDDIMVTDHVVDAFFYGIKYLRGHVPSAHPHQLVTNKCYDFYVKNERKATLEQEVDFVKKLHTKYLRAVADGHIKAKHGGSASSIFDQIERYLEFDADRKARNKAKKTARKRANKIVRREAREAAKKNTN